MNVKIIIYNTQFYREIKLSGYYRNGVTIGTLDESQIILNRLQWGTDFIVRIFREGEKWAIACSETVCIKQADAYKSYRCLLTLQEAVSVCFTIRDTELFHIELLNDFSDNCEDYQREISVEGLSSFSIGGNDQDTIRIQDSILKNHYAWFTRIDNGYQVSQSRADYKVLLNGVPVSSEQFFMGNQEFIGIDGYTFYLKDHVLYTSMKYVIETKLPDNVTELQTNHLHYPCFVRSPRQRFEDPDEKIEILPPKTRGTKPDKNLLETLFPILLSTGMMMAIRMGYGSNNRMIILYAGMMLTTVIMSIYNYTNNTREYKKDLVKRENDYNRYISEQEQQIQALRKKEQYIASQKILSLDAHLCVIEEFDSRLFEKMRDHEDFLEIPLGIGTVESKNQISYKKQEYREVADPLMDYPQKISEKYRYIEKMPVTINLSELDAIGFVGNRDRLYQMAKNLILTIASEHYYQDIKICLLLDEEDTAYFAWARWIKNMTEDNVIRLFGYNEKSNNIVIEFLYSELSNREQVKKNETESFQQYVVLVYRSEAIMTHPISKLVGCAAKRGFHFIFFEEYAELLNLHCEKRVFLHNTENMAYIQDIKKGEQIQTFTYEHVPMERAAKAAQRLGDIYVSEVSLEASLVKNISLYELLGIKTAKDINLESRWGKSKVYESMAAPLGVKSGEEVVYLDIHEKFHGPHGLVAGTTGSGKSEILQSYILSMATLFHPYEVGFIIIDFKGGGMANQFKDLPHLNGAITNIDDGEIERSLSSIKAELRKRQRYFSEYEVNHIDEYIKLYKKKIAKVPLPHLILIVDEFAELKSEQPEFMKELISAARIGRSLGVHLILATQKPAGVVNDQIWSNSKFKLCLKVQDKSDSNEVLKSPLAADIREPGRAYLQVGNNEIFQLFQSAYSGAPVPSRNLVEQKKIKISQVDLSGQRHVLYEQKPVKEEVTRTQLDALVEHVVNYCKEKQIEKLPDICLPALPNLLFSDMWNYENDTTDLRIPVGVYDDPDHQRQCVLDLDVTQNATVIVGSMQTGKTNLMQLMIRELAISFSPRQLTMFILDFDTMILKNFEALPHVGGVFVSNQEGKIVPMIKTLREEIEKRKKEFSKLGITSYSSYLEAKLEELPQVMVFIDNVGMLKETYLSCFEELMKLVRDGITYGISFVVTSKQVNHIGYKHLNLFTNRIALYCNDNMEYNVLFERCKKTLHLIPGRILVSKDKTTYEGQSFMSFLGEREIDRVNGMRKFVEEMVSTYQKKESALQIRTVPDILTDQILLDNAEDGWYPYCIPIGMNHENLEVDTIRADQYPIIGISGNPESKSRYVKYLLHWLYGYRTQAEVEIICCDKPDCELLEVQTIVDRYYFDEHDVISELDRILFINRERLERSNKREDEKLILMVLNDVSIYERLSVDQERFPLVEKLMMQGIKARIVLILSDIPNEKIKHHPCRMISLFATTESIFFTHQMEEQKLFYLSSAEKQKKYTRLEENDVYFKYHNRLMKYRFSDI